MNSTEKEFQKKEDFIITSENLNTSSHSKLPVAILKNPYLTPHVIRHTLLHPPCNTDQVITPPGDMTCCISNL